MSTSISNPATTQIGFGITGNGPKDTVSISVSIETEATFLLFQLGLVDRVIVLSMSASCSSATCPDLKENADGGEI
jgi:hypothetical protein